MIQSLSYSNDFDPIKDVTKSVIRFVNWAYNIIDRIAGLVGIVILSPIFAIFTFSLWAALVYSNRGFKKSMARLFNSINANTDHRELMHLHRLFKNQRIDIERVIKRSSSVSTHFLFKPLYSQITVSRNLMFDSEQRLHKTIYPHLSNPLSDEQKKQLMELSKNFEGIFDQELN